MQTPAAYISFTDGRCRRLRAREVPAQVEEAIAACDATETPAKLLDESYTVVAEVRRVSSAMNGFAVFSLN